MKLRSGIKLLTEIEGTGREVKRGDWVKARLSGWLNKGEAIQQNEVAEVVVGRRRWIAGVEYSLIGMKAGGKRKVCISPRLAYREAGVKDRVPPGAVLIYEIEVLEVAEGGR